MKPDQKDIPYGYAHCFATDEQCPRRGECLRALVAEFPLPNPEYPETTVIDPRYIATLKDKGDCAHYRNATPRQYARGMSKMFDAVPGKQLRAVRSRVQQCFTCRSYYFLSRKGTRLISPDEQKKIAAVFRQLCPDLQPVYDSLENAYDW